MQLTARRASASACRMVTCFNLCQCLTLAAARGQSQRSKHPRAEKCCLLPLHPRASACRMVTCINPCQCLTLLSDPIKQSRKMQLPAAKASDPRPKKCCLLTFHPPASACRTVTCANPCQCLTLLSDPIKKSRKMQLPAAKASDPRPKKGCLLTLPPPASACRTVTCVNPCQCLTLLSGLIKKSRSRPRPEPAIQAPKDHPRTQKMLPPTASSSCQRVSNGYLRQPWPVPNVAF